MSARPPDPLLMFSLDHGYADRDRDGCQSSLLTISPFSKRLDAFCYLELSNCNHTDESYCVTVDQYCGRLEESGHRQSRKHSAEMASRREMCRSSRLSRRIVTSRVLSGDYRTVARLTFRKLIRGSRRVNGLLMAIGLVAWFRLRTCRSPEPQKPSGFHLHGLRGQLQR